MMGITYGKVRSPADAYCAQSPSAYTLGAEVCNMSFTTTPRSHSRPAAEASAVSARRPTALSTMCAAITLPSANCTFKLPSAPSNAVTVVPKCQTTPSACSAARSCSPASVGSSSASGRAEGSTTCTVTPACTRSLANSQPIRPAPMITTVLEVLGSVALGSSASAWWNMPKSSRLLMDFTWSAAVPITGMRTGWAPVASTSCL